MHWVLCKVCLTEKKIVVYDSMKSIDFKQWKQILQPLACFIPIILRSIGFYAQSEVSTPLVEKIWDVERVNMANVPQQADG